jgi:hypothetical protein
MSKTKSSEKINPNSKCNFNAPNGSRTSKQSGFKPGLLPPINRNNTGHKGLQSGKTKLHKATPMV